MNVLSIHDGHNASAAFFKDGKLIDCVSEERINRIKFFTGWPELSIAYVLESSGINLAEIDAVTVSHLGGWGYFKRKLNFKNNFTLNPKFILGDLYNIFLMIKKEIFIRKYFKKYGIKKFYFCDHHLAHAASAYYFSGFDDALAVTMDGLGDSLSHTAYAVRQGEWKKLLSGGGNASLGTFYAAVTEALGFKPNRHEGKIVGLAAIGDHNKIKCRKEDFIYITEDKKDFKRARYNQMIDKVKALLQEGKTREDISAYAQDILEKNTIKHINKLCEMTGLKNIVLAGGVFANVKLNEKITEQCPIEKIFIQPGMGDEGLVLGSAAYYLDQIDGSLEKEKISDVYLGNSYSNEYIEDLLTKQNYKYEVVDNIAEKAAQMVNDGVIVGWFDGKMEFGPRALGHRTIMADPRNKEINDSLNKKLRRSEFMPFAPSVMIDYAQDVFEHIEPSLHAAEFMTITYKVKEEWQDKIKGVVHVDGTARPQFVKQDINGNYYQVIKEFYKLSGIPLIINTSFNIHEEPIVCSPDDALRSLDQQAVDCVIFNNKYLVKKYE